jgi:hypothetical protein
MKPTQDLHRISTSMWYNRALEGRLPSAGRWPANPKQRRKL